VFILKVMPDGAIHIKRQGQQTGYLKTQKST